MPSFSSLAVLVAFSVSASSAVQERAVTNLPANGKFDYQIGGSYTPESDVKVVDRDRSDSPVSGLYNICYVNAFQTQPEEKSFWTSNHSDLLLRKANGKLFEDPDWPGEYFLDISTDAKRQAIAAIVNGWIDGCASKGFQAIEPDNLDTYTRSKKLLTQADAVAYAQLLVNHAHSKGLAIAQKNTGDLSSVGKTTIGFDFAIVEECQYYNECDSYTDVYGAQMVEIEYTDDDDGKAFKPACGARGSSISIILRDRDVVPKGNSAYSYSEC